MNVVASSKFESVEDSSTLSAAEARGLLELVASDDLRELPRVEDVAETLHLDVREVEALLERVRATPKEVAPQQKKSNGVFAYAGWVVAAVALAGVLLTRTPSKAVPVTSPVPLTFPAGPPAAAPVKDIVVMPMNLLPPEGYEVSVQGDGVRLTVAGRKDVRLTSQAGIKDRLVQCLSLLLQRAETVGAGQAMQSGPRGFANFTREFQVTVVGPGSANVTFPVSTEMHSGPNSIPTYKWRQASLENSLDSLFDPSDHRVGPESGAKNYVFPPSGFEVRMMGRRIAGSSPGPQVVEPFDEPVVRKRLFDALRTMLDNDLKPVEGRWRQDAEKERHLKVPDHTYFTIETLENRLDFEVPTKPGTPASVQNRILQQKVEEAIQIWKRAGKAGAG